ncbi:MAG: hypothetical protein H6622_11635 [Halobacteriovoraceae bacterium]|nr:hypothetical protein [Halobacteriovoraceae bacterium]
MFRVLYSFILIFLSLSSYSIIEFEDGVFPELAPNSRALGMGNAYICKVDGAEAAFYNPAGLGTVRDFHFHLTNLHIETNKGWLRASTGGQLLEAVPNTFKGFSSDGMRELLQDKNGALAIMRFHAAPNIAMRYFTAGYLFAQQSRGYIENSTAPYEYTFRRDQGPYAALNISLFGGIIKFGAMGILLIRKEYQADLDQNTKVDIGASEYSNGTGAFVNAGFRLTLPIALLPTVAAVYHNVAGQDWSANGGAGTPTDIKSAIDVGFSVTPQIGNATRIHFEANYKDVTGVHSGLSMVRRINAGMELDFARVFFMRVGYGDGYGSGGLGFRTDKLEFDITSYAVDTTASSFRGKEDRRFALTLSAGY